MWVIQGSKLWLECVVARPRASAQVTATSGEASPRYMAYDGLADQSSRNGDTVPWEGVSRAG